MKKIVLIIVLFLTTNTSVQAVDNPPALPGVDSDLQEYILNETPQLPAIPNSFTPSLPLASTSPETDDLLPDNPNGLVDFNIENSYAVQDTIGQVTAQIWRIMLVLAVLIVIYAAYLMIVVGTEDAIKKSKSIIVMTVVAFLIASLALLIVNIIGTLFT